MKKRISIFTVVIAVMIGCAFLLPGPKKTGAEEKSEGDKLQIVAAIFPIYDWVQNILGENPGDAEVNMLLDTGVDLHSYQPSADDIMQISACDIFIYVGGESDKWVEDALKEAVNKDMVVINLLNVLGDQVKEEELIAGMEGEEEEGEEEEPEYDEHIWLSLRNASVLTDHIADAIAEVDAADADAYMANAEAYKEKLSSLDAEYQEAVSAAEKDTLLFGDRFPFRYMTDDYGLSYFAAFPGCSAETEASFETIVFLADKVNELSLSSILTIEGSDHKIAETIRESTKSRDQQILTMNSMQSTTLEDAEGGTSYLSIMEDNLEVLKEALK